MLKICRFDKGPPFSVFTGWTRRALGGGNGGGALLKVVIVFMRSLDNHLPWASLSDSITVGIFSYKVE